ncbi:MAG: hypothetical protein MZV70_49910 [Desulfobacterales bacterium]|nr:hypothetical protein [Desulfobacterales bacterium]
MDYVSLLDMGVGAATIKYVAEYQAFGNSRKIGNVVLSTCLFNSGFPTSACAGPCVRGRNIVYIPDRPEGFRRCATHLRLGSA